jgi:hypothetical protein
MHHFFPLLSPSLLLSPFLSLYISVRVWLSQGFGRNLEVDCPESHTGQKRLLIASNSYLIDPQALQTQPHALRDLLPCPAPRHGRDLGVHDSPFLEVRLTQERFTGAWRMRWVDARGV